MRLGFDWLGRQVSVVIDRPLGSAHPDRTDMIYPVNYGYISGTTAGDGEPIDVYVIGETEPLKCVVVFIVAIIRRKDDVEDKLVGGRALTCPAPGEIMDEVRFTERWFDVTIETLSGRASYARGAPST